MQASNLPTKVPLPFANAGTKNTIPLASQIGVTPGAASLTDGFPPLTFTPLASGGVPPAGADFNGILNLITGVQQWQSAGGIFKYDSAFSTSVGGYPKGAILESSDGSTLWLCLADNNTTDPDGATPANWAPAASYGIAAITGLTNANVTLTPAQYGKRIITLSGTLTGNVQIIFPTTAQKWLVINNATGSFTATCKTAAGTGVAITQGGSQQLYGDGTNIVNFGGISQTAADARYAALAGSLSQVFSASSIHAGEVVPPAAADLVLRSDTKLNAVNLAGTVLVPVQAGPASTGTELTTLTQIRSITGAIPTNSAGAGQWTALSPVSGSSTLPSGGTWAYFGSNNGTGFAGVAAGGSVVWSGTATNFFGFCWRIA